MKDTSKKINEVLLAVIKFLFSVETLVTVLFLASMIVLLITVYSINIIAFGFTLSAILLGVALLLNVNLNNN